MAMHRSIFCRTKKFYECGKPRAFFCLRLWLVCACAVILPIRVTYAEALPHFIAQVEPFLTLLAGRSSVADVEKILGQAANQIKTDLLEYRPPSGAAGIDKIQVEYFSDTHLVARIDLWLSAPMPVAELKARFGNSVLQQTRKDGKREEFFFPRLLGLITSQDQADLAIGISHLAPTTLANVFCDQSAQLIREKRYAEAKEPADNAVLVDPDYARGFLAQGIHYYYMNNFDEAMVRFVAASRAKYTARRRAHAHTWLADVYWMKKQQPELARAEFGKAMALAADFDAVYLDYGRFLKAQKDNDGALKAFAKASELGQSPNEARMELAVLYVNQKAADKALPYLVQLAAWADGGGKSTSALLGADTIYGFYAYALAAVRGKRNPLLGADDSETNKIIATYEKALRLNTKALWVYVELGREYQDSSEMAKAEATYRQGLALDAKHIALNQQLAETLLALGRYDAALRQAEVALSLAPASGNSMMTMARAYALLRKGTEAIAWLRKAGAAGYQAQYRGNLILEDGVFEDYINEDELQRLLPGRR